MNRVVAAISLFLLSLGVQGCLRGETHSVDEILASEKRTYMESGKDSLDKSVADSLQKISQDLDTLVAKDGGGNVSAPSKEIAEILSTLVDKANYTCRPAMGELMNQYRGIADSNVVVPGVPQGAKVKLLAARTYSLLSSELASTKFRL